MPCQSQENVNRLQAGLQRICSRRSDFNAKVNKLKHWLREMGHPGEIDNKVTKRALETSISGSINNSEKNTQNNSPKGYLSADI